MDTCFLFVIFCCCIHFCFSDDLPQLDTDLGRVRGYWKTSLGGKKFAAFEGIPYAEPPVGDLRFEEPQPIKSWSGSWEADILHTCPQGGMVPSDDISGEEDCLYLNVYVPEESLGKTKALDVVISIHGGAFILGSAQMLNYPELFMDTNVVLVTINCRIGIFGFLSTEDKVIPGNNGMKDQSLALKWVKDNIESFGGNSESVTIIGISAGGASVHLHYFSPLSKGLFHRGISQSGTALASWSVIKKPLETAKRLAQLVGCPDTSTQELKSCLKKRPMQNIMKQLKQFSILDGALSTVSFGPVVETNSKQPFLEKDPYLLLKEGNVYDVPWITSEVADEGLVQTPNTFFVIDKLNEQWSEVAPELLDCVHTLPESEREKAFAEVLEFYLGPGENINKENFMNFTKIFTDRGFRIPAELSAKLQSNVTKSSIYFYHFNYADGVNKQTATYGISEVDGIAHGNDIFYLNGMPGQKPFSEQDQRLKDKFHNMLVSYIKTNKPSFDGTDTWKPTETAELTYLNINGPEDMKIYKTEDMGHYSFWSKLKLQEYENMIVEDKL